MSGRRGRWRTRAGALVATALVAFGLVALPLAEPAGAPNRPGPEADPATVPFGSNARPLARAETLHRFRVADREAQAVFAALVATRADLAATLRRAGARAPRDLWMIRADVSGDGWPELFLVLDTLSQCGSAGCVTHVLTRRNGVWHEVCETHSDGVVAIAERREGGAGWRGFRATYRMRWAEAPARPGGVLCVEGALVPRAAQSRVEDGR